MRKDYLYEVDLMCIDSKGKEIVLLNDIIEKGNGKKLSIKAKTIHFLYDISEKDSLMLNSWDTTIQKDKIKKYWKEIGHKDHYPEYFI